MKNKFPSYFVTNEEEIAKMWGNAIFIVDTNVLLNQYRYTEKTRTEFFEIFDALKERLWTPNQVAKEYLHNRPGVLFEQGAVFGRGVSVLNALKEITTEKITKDLQFDSHPFIDKKAVNDEIIRTLEKIEKDLLDKQAEHSDSIDNDPIHAKIVSIFDGRVGDGYDEEALVLHKATGKKRYEKKLPPGYRDSGKSDDLQFGDYIIWRQCLDKAVSEKKPIIFITNDRKEDWWWITKGKTIGPRIELLDEMRSEADVDFYMYNSDRFLLFARKYLKAVIDDSAIDEIKQVRMRKNKRLRSLPDYLSPDYLEWMKLAEFEAQEAAKLKELARYCSSQEILKSEIEKLPGLDSLSAMRSAFELENELLRKKIEMYSRPLSGSYPTLASLFKYHTQTGGGLLSSGNEEGNDDSSDEDGTK